MKMVFGCIFMEKEINSSEMNCMHRLLQVHYYLSHFQQADQGTDDKLHWGTWTSVNHSET